MDKANINVCDILYDLGNAFYEGNKQPFENVLLVGMQHVLGTTVDMLSVMKQFGLTDAVIGGKTYSTHQESAEKIDALGFTYVPDGSQLGYGRFDDCMQEVVHRIWFHALKKIALKKYKLLIILDDGADLLRATPGSFFNELNTAGIKNKPEMIIGIEQTRGGTNHPLFSGLPFPIINVAGSFIKTHLEYPKVAEIIAQQIITLIEQTVVKKRATRPVIGLLGYGTMGKSIASNFVNKGFTVIAYDKNRGKRQEATKIVHYDNSAVLIANADVIVGCTGEDITAIKQNLSALLYSRQKKWLINAGSKDHEFNSLLRTIQNEARALGYVPKPLQTIRYENRGGAELEIIRGGFPVNFTNQQHSVSPQHIWPTRGSLMLACLTACRVRHNTFRQSSRNINTFMLSPEAQVLIMNKYHNLNQEQNPLSQLNQKTMYEFIMRHSDGELLNLDLKKVAQLA
jgi:S-adenosylhomocysteine hydrolase